MDNVERPSWQAQLSGRKTWSIYPPPECESVCEPMLNVTIEKGEIGKRIPGVQKKNWTLFDFM
jgi:hypothetical protein